MREGYQDILTWNTYERKNRPVEGRYRWLSVGILLTESILCYKYRIGTGNLHLDARTPLYIIIPWALYLGTSFSFWLYLRFKPGRTVKYLEVEPPAFSPQKLGFIDSPKKVKFN